MLVALVVAYGAVRAFPGSASRPPYAMVLTAGLAYVAAAGWDFYEHSHRNDPAVVHVLIGVAWVALLAGVVLATVLFRRRPD